MAHPSATTHFFPNPQHRAAALRPSRARCYALVVPQQVVPRQPVGYRLCGPGSRTSLVLAALSRARPPATWPRPTAPLAVAAASPLAPLGQAACGQGPFRPTRPSAHAACVALSVSPGYRRAAFAIGQAAGAPRESSRQGAPRPALLTPARLSTPPAQPAPPRPSPAQLLAARWPPRQCPHRAMHQWPTGLIPTSCPARPIKSLKPIVRAPPLSPSSTSVSRTSRIPCFPYFGHRR
jgi:hypothetical protein